MSRRFGGPYPILAVVILLAVALAIIGLALPLPGMDWLIPSPEDAAQTFLSALAARRYAGAMESLSQDLRQQTTEEELIALMESLAQSPRQGIQDARGRDAQEQEDTATASVVVKFGDNSETTVEIPLVKENALWKVSSLDAIRGLAR